MTDKHTFLCFDPSDLEVASGMVRALDIKKKWRVTIEPYRKRRTTDQNNYMWAMYEEIAKHTGHTPNEIHEWCKAQFAPPCRVRIRGDVVEYRSTAKLNTAEMSEYLERVRAWAATDLNMTLSTYSEAACPAP